MKIPQSALEIIQEFEGFRAETYTDSAGVYTIGYGTTARAFVGIDPMPGMVISEKQAEVYLKRAVRNFADIIEPEIKRNVSENAWSALLSLTYNIGPTAFINSTLLRKFNAGDTQGAADEFLRWTKADGQTLRGLARRRWRERTLFLTPDNPPRPWVALYGALWAFITSLLRKTK